MNTTFQFEPENPSYDGNRAAIRTIAIGTYNNYKFYVMDYGTHPCAYIVLPKKHPLRKFDEDDIHLDCHGGITHAGTIGDRFDNEYTIGWDYAHYNDYYADPMMSNVDAHKWSINEILTEVYAVIDQIISKYDKKTV